MYFGCELLPPKEAKLVPLRILAHLGDAVFALFERERQTLQSVNVRQMHEKTASRASATTQAELLTIITPHLTDEEKDLVRRARNMKASGSRSAGQASYRRATAFEALLGYLYLTEPERLRNLLSLTLTNAASVDATHIDK
jgi:ribonuclease III family protein